MDRKVLGRGLEALIPTSDPNAPKERVQMLKVTQVQPSSFQPRLNFSQDKIEQLARSIQEKGIIQPILVRALDGDRYELIAGERRLRAAKHLGLTEVPAIVRRVADADLLEMSIVENIQREELNALEEAKAYRRLAQEFGFTQETIAQRVGKDKTSISNLLRILNLPQTIQDFLSENRISLGHAKAILSVTEEKRQIALCEKILKKSLSVRQAELLASPGRPRFSGRSAARVEKDAEIRALEEKLQHKLGTKVRIQHGRKRGKIEIEYYSLDDLDRVLRLLGAN